MADLRDLLARLGFADPRSLLPSGNLVFGSGRAVVADNPFRREAERDPGRLVVMFLKGPADAERVALLQAAITGPEVVHAEGRQLYAVYPAGIGRSRLTNSLVETKLGVRCTGRHWNTVLNLWALAKP